MLMVLTALIILCQRAALADISEIKDTIVQNPLFPAEYSISADYNPDKNRAWTFHEISNKFTWKIKDKPCFLVPDGVWVAVDIAPNSDRAWQCSEVTTGMKYKFK